jgi:L-alanine-DL-glutamate epimerase-like enolase superfamily enzyme
LVKELPQVNDGYLTVHDTLDLGVEVNEEVIAELCVN